MSDAMPPTSRPLRVLVIDDEAPIRARLREILEEAGFEVVEAGDGKQGLRLLRKQRFRYGRDTPVHLVVTDMLVPGTDGTETIIELRRHYPQVKVIAMSGEDPERLRLAKVLGADEIVSSPLPHINFSMWCLKSRSVSFGRCLRRVRGPISRRLAVDERYHAYRRR